MWAQIVGKVRMTFTPRAVVDFYEEVPGPEVVT
jgi:hypothetical protein